MTRNPANTTKNVSVQPGTASTMESPSSREPLRRSSRARSFPGYRCSTTASPTQTTHDVMPKARKGAKHPHRDASIRPAGIPNTVASEYAVMTMARDLPRRLSGTSPSTSESTSDQQSPAAPPAAARARTKTNRLGAPEHASVATANIAYKRSNSRLGSAR
ncbi:MAG: hypothetical protein QM784_21235 [Polyangiaceae bacterium]